MTTLTESPPTRPAWKSLADIPTSLGGIPADRIRWVPTPGTATEADCLQVGETDRLCELVDKTLVEKAIGTPEGFFGQKVAFYLMAFVSPRRLGMVIGEGGFFRIGEGNIRLPDASFTSRDRLPNPLPQVSGWCPDLCVEVFSPGNTRAEMRRKRAEYFAAGCRLLWIFDRKRRICEVFTSETVSFEIGIDGVIDGGSVLPGFTLPMTELFAEFDDYFPDTSP